MKKRQINKNKYIIITLFVFLMTLMAYYFIITKQPSDDGPVIISRNRPETLFECSQDEVSEIVICPPNSERYTLINTTEGLVLSGDDDFSLKNKKADMILSNAAHIIAEETIVDTGVYVTDLKAFGLDLPICEAIISYTDGSANHLRIGNQIVGSTPYYYFMLNDDSHIYAGATDMYDAFSADLISIRSFEQPVFNGELIDRITFRTEEVIVEFVRTASGWNMEKPFLYPLDQTKVDSFLKKLENLTFAKYIDHCDDNNILSFGLEDPALTLSLLQTKSVVTVKDADENEQIIILPEINLELAIGDQYGTYEYYVSYDSDIYTMTSFSGQFILSFDYLEFLEAYPLNALLGAVSGINIDADGISKHYSLMYHEKILQDGSLETDDDGNQLYETTVTSEGNNVSLEEFISWYTKVKHIKGEGNLPSGYTFDQDNPVWQITFIFPDQERRIVFYNFDNLYYAMSIDGTALYYIDRKTADNLFTATP